MTSAERHLTGRVRAIALVTAMACALLLSWSAGAPPAEAYELTGHRFATRTITFHDTTRHRAAVRAAARAWHASGARIRFAATPRSRARVLVRYLPRDVCLGLARLSTARGVASSATVYLPRPSQATRSCSDRFSITLIAAHEFGHVLGLGHERRRCATMNPVGNRLGGRRCRSGQGASSLWEWRCRVLEQDDVRGAVSLYGGRVRPHGRATCPLYRQQAPLEDFQLILDEATGLQASFTRPADRRVPRFLTRPLGGFDARGFNVEYALDVCPPVKAGVITGWDVPVAAIQRQQLGVLAPGRYCVTAWAVDRLGRPSRSIQTWVDVPEPQPAPL